MLRAVTGVDGWTCGWGFRIVYQKDRSGVFGPKLFFPTAGFGERRDFKQEQDRGFFLPWKALSQLWGNWQSALVGTPSDACNACNDHSVTFWWCCTDGI